ncbi:AI-2E family transporter YdiK [Undibacterium sp.]|uniref:AI-2E family transporter YdiK n=1 Tax=Undibacterium sp. TaxID=1914977 RepID=UPI0025E30EF6|nr:AI-2E family transporter YdiK [Undibacterium sp.]
MIKKQGDLTRTILAILCIFLLIAGSLWVLRPFLGSLIWAVMLVVATWPMLVSLERKLGGKRGLAVSVMTLGMLLLLVIPLWLAISTIAEHAEGIVSLAKKFADTGLPQPPAWVQTVPLVGNKLATTWGQLADGGAQGLVSKAQPYAAQTGSWVLSQVGSVGGLLLQFILVVMMSAILYSTGEVAAHSVRRFGYRLAGERGLSSILLAGGAIRGVALGVGVTAIVQTVLGGIGLAIAGVPFASLLSALMLMFCIAQIGPALVLFPAVGWMFWMGHSSWGVFLLIWSLIVTTLDNFLRPMLIRKGADLPLLLIFAGVIGGMLGFGLIGLFIGPVVLAVTYTLLDAWMDDDLTLAHAPGPESSLASAPEPVPEVTPATISELIPAPAPAAISDKP